MAYFKADADTVDQLISEGAISVVINDSDLKLYHDIYAKVRNDGNYHSIRALVQPHDLEVEQIARVFMGSPDFVYLAHEYVNSYIKYKRERGDFWRIPAETLAAEAGDCDDMAILLCSILRNYLPPEKVFCAFGTWVIGGKIEGHMFVVTDDLQGEDIILESTMEPGVAQKGTYVIYGIFNDKYAYSTDLGVKEFDLLPIGTEVPMEV